MKNKKILRSIIAATFAIIVLFSNLTSRMAYKLGTSNVYLNSIYGDDITKSWYYETYRTNNYSLGSVIASIYMNNLKNKKYELSKEEIEEQITKRDPLLKDKNGNLYFYQTGSYAASTNAKHYSTLAWQIVRLADPSKKPSKAQKTSSYLKNSSKATSEGYELITLFGDCYSDESAKADSLARYKDPSSLKSIAKKFSDKGVKIKDATKNGKFSENVLCVGNYYWQSGSTINTLFVIPIDYLLMIMAQTGHTEWLIEILAALNTGTDYYMGINPVYGVTNDTTRDDFKGFPKYYYEEENSNNCYHPEYVYDFTDFWDGNKSFEKTSGINSWKDAEKAFFDNIYLKFSEYYNITKSYYDVDTKEIIYKERVSSNEAKKFKNAKAKIEYEEEVESSTGEVFKVKESNKNIFYCLHIKQNNTIFGDEDDLKDFLSPDVTVSGVSAYSITVSTDANTITTEKTAKSDTLVFYIPVEKETKSDINVEVRYVKAGDLGKTSTAKYNIGDTVYTEHFDEEEGLSKIIYSTGQANFKKPFSKEEIEGIGNVDTFKLGNTKYGVATASNWGSYAPILSQSKTDNLLNYTTYSEIKAKDSIALMLKNQADGVRKQYYTSNSVSIYEKGIEKYTAVMYIPVLELNTGSGSTSPHIEPSTGQVTIVKNPYELANTSNNKLTELSAADIRTFNYDDDEYEIGTAIPTDNVIINGVEADTWAGQISLKLNKYEKKINVSTYVNVDYTWEQQEPRVGWSYVSDGKGGYTSSSYVYYVTVTYGGSYPLLKSYEWDYGGPVTYMQYQGATSQLYQLNKLLTKNNSWESDINYTSNIDIPYYVGVNPYHPDTKTVYFAANDVSSCGGSTPSSESNQKDLISGGYATHVYIPEVKTYLTGSGSAGHFSSAGAAIAAAQSLANSLCDELYHNEVDDKLLIPYDDKVELNEVEYVLKDSGGTMKLTTESGTKTVTDGYIHNIAKQTNDKFHAEEEIYIPTEKNNGVYSTYLEATYKKILHGTESSQITLRIDGKGADGADETGDEIDDHILDRAAAGPSGTTSNYLDNEPIKVHSPVISPTRFVNPEAKTQSTCISPVDQLITDQYYTLSFDWTNLFKGRVGYDSGYYDPEGLTKYVAKKEVRFPFPVKLNGTYYSCSVRDVMVDEFGDYHDVNFTEWIELPSSQYLTFEIYIPTWAKSGVYDASYGVTRRPDLTLASIETRVWANNAEAKVEELMISEGLTEEQVLKRYETELIRYEGNEDRTNYITIYRLPCQITPTLYGFEVITTNDETSFGDDGYADKNHSLVKNKEERKVGLYNRLGGNDVISTNGQDYATWNSDHTLPFTTGKALYPTMGTAKLGEEFTFSLKSICGNIGNDADYIKITPHYRYVAEDGTVYEENQLRLYYDSGSNMYIEMGSDRDTAAMYKNTSYLRDQRYAYATCFDTFNPACSFGHVGTENCGLYTNTFALTAAHKNNMTLSTVTARLINTLLNVKSDFGSFSDVTVPYTSMLYSGNETELRDNLTGLTNLRYNAPTNSYGTLSNSEKYSFEESMQTWYAKYTVPENLKVALRTQPDGTQFSVWEEGVRGESGFIEGFINENSYFTKDDNDKYFLHDGYLVLSFDIDLYDDNRKIASYHNAVLDMWSRENGNLGEYIAYYGSYYVDGSGMTMPTGNVVTIPARSGDMAVIPLKAGTINDTEYDVGILWIGI